MAADNRVGFAMVLQKLRVCRDTGNRTPPTMRMNALSVFTTYGFKHKKVKVEVTVAPLNMLVGEATIILSAGGLRVFIACGPSGTGKSTIVHGVFEKLASEIPHPRITVSTICGSTFSRIDGPGPQGQKQREVWVSTWLDHIQSTAITKSTAMNSLSSRATTVSQRARVQEAVLYNDKYISDLIALHIAGQNTDSARSHTSHLSKHLTRLIDNNRIHELVLYVGIKSQVVEESVAQVVEAYIGKS